jgi:oligopeptide transport system substrate-binding protein
VDRQVKVAQDSLDPATRMQAFARIQELLIEDAALIPIYERGTLYVQDPRLQGVVRRVVGADPDFTNAYVVGN